MKQESKNNKYLYVEGKKLKHDYRHHLNMLKWKIV